MEVDGEGRGKWKGGAYEIPCTKQNYYPCYIKHKVHPQNFICALYATIDIFLTLTLVLTCIVSL